MIRHPMKSLAWSLVFFGATTMSYASDLLVEHGGIKVYKSKAAKSADFESMYFVNLDGLKKSKTEMETYGDVLDYQTGLYAVMKLEGDNVAKLSSELHAAGLACGVLFKLNGDTVSTKKVLAPDPIIAINNKLDAVVAANALVSADNIKTNIEELSVIHTRFHSSSTGIAVTEQILGKYRQMAQGREDVTIEAFDHQSATPQDSVLVRIQGQTRPDEIIVLGSHIDSVNWSGGSSQRAPGSDDNASGTGTNMEVFRVLMEQNIRLERTLEIHGYAAEEMGLVGSQDMAMKYKNAAKKVIAMVQHDMNIYGVGPDKIWFVTNNTNASLNSQLSSLVSQYQTVLQGNAVLSGGNSDHYSWTRAGYPAAFPFENPQSYNNAIHTANDTIARAAKFTQAAEFAKLGLAYIYHFGGLVQ